MSGAVNRACRAAIALSVGVLLLVPIQAARGAIVANLDGFDTCNAPTTSNMQTWWTSSPYFYTAIYIGGVNRSCPNTNLTSSWVTTVHNQGWGFQPLWVGLQDPCSGFASTFSTDPATAQGQGQAAANNAVSAAQGLGFSTGAVIYYDLEGYDTSNATCVSAANSFITGWDQQMTTLGWSSGVYGSSSGSNMDALWNLTTNPKNGWLAEYNNVNTVWGLQVPNVDWAKDHRSHQYKAPHNENWGGVTIFIDTNCSVGQYDKPSASVPGEFDPIGTNEANGPSEDPSC